MRNRRCIARLSPFLLGGIWALFAIGSHAAPTISSFSPGFGSSSDTTPIIIYGSGFYPGTLVVKFNNATAVNPFPNAAGTQIQVFVPGAAPLGSGPIFVSVNGVGTYSADDFTVIGSGPYISGFSPAVGSAGANVVISGAHFLNPTTVSFNGAVTVTNPTTSTSFTVKVPAGATTGPITVSTAGGNYTSLTNFFVPPVITGFAPASGRSGTNVVITGTNLLGATAVRFNGVNASFTVISNNAIHATAPAGITTGPIQVVAPAGSYPSSSNFVVLPTVTSFTPGFGPVGTSVTISGANFNVGTPVVKFNGTTSTSVSGVTAGQLTATVPNGATTGPITVTTTDGTGTSPNLFYLPPRITSFSPNNSLPGSTTTISGTNFTGASSVSFNGVAASFTVSNNTTIGAIVPGGFNTGPITITTPGGTTNTSSLANSNFFAVPFISGFSPLQGLPGTNVSLFGSSFLGTTAVQFPAAGGGTTNAPILSVNNGQITTRVPTNAVSGPITVVTPAGSASSSGSFFLQYADLLVTVADSPDPVPVDGNLTYNIQVRNNGPFASAVSMTNVLPPGVSFVSSTAGSTVSNVTTVNFGTLGVSVTSNVTIVAKPMNDAVNITNYTHAFSGPPSIYAPVLTATYVEPLRLLSIGIYSPSEVLLSWPTSLSNYTLQYKNSLDTNVPWIDVLIPPATNGGSNLISQPRSDPFRVFRLRN